MTTKMKRACPRCGVELAHDRDLCDTNGTAGHMRALMSACRECGWAEITAPSEECRTCPGIRNATKKATRVKCTACIEGVICKFPCALDKLTQPVCSGCVYAHAPVSVCVKRAASMDECYEAQEGAVC